MDRTYSTPFSFFPSPLFGVMRVAVLFVALLLIAAATAMNTNCPGSYDTCSERASAGRRLLSLFERLFRLEIVELFLWRPERRSLWLALCAELWQRLWYGQNIDRCQG